MQLHKPKLPAKMCMRHISVAIYHVTIPMHSFHIITRITALAVMQELLMRLTYIYKHFYQTSNNSSEHFVVRSLFCQTDMYI